MFVSVEMKLEELGSGSHSELLDGQQTQGQVAPD